MSLLAKKCCACNAMRCRPLRSMSEHYELPALFRIIAAHLHLGEVSIEVLVRIHNTKAFLSACHAITQTKQPEKFIHRVIPRSVNLSYSVSVVSQS